MARFAYLGAALLLAGSACAGDDPAVVPVYEEPRHRLVFEKGSTRIFSTSIPAGDTSLFHRHENPTVYVRIQPALMHNQNLNEDWTEFDPNRLGEVGDLLFLDYAKKPQQHRVKNVDRRSFQVVGVINYGAGSQEPSSAVSAAAELDNRWFRAYRFRVAAGEQTGTHVHAHPVFLVQVDRGNSNVLEHGQPIAEKTVAAAWSWHDPGVEHRLQNLGAEDVELIEIEIK